MGHDEPTETSEGPWTPVTPYEDSLGWLHAVSRPCVNCKHALIDHHNNPFEGRAECTWCDCLSFEDPIPANQEDREASDES